MSQWITYRMVLHKDCIFHTFFRMKPTYPIPYVEIGRTYAVLRQGGAPQGRAAAELALPSARVRLLEAGLRRHRPRCGRDAAHAAAVLAAGGYPVLDR